MTNEIKSDTYTNYSKTRLTVRFTRPLIQLKSLMKIKAAVHERDAVYLAEVMRLMTQKELMKFNGLCY